MSKHNPPSETRLLMRAQSAPWSAGVELYIGTRDRKSNVREIIMERTEEATVPQPSFVLENDQAQALMDDLWHCGLRPTEGTGSAGALAATQQHLKDMQRLVFESKLFAKR